MADTVRTKSEVMALLNDNVTGDISPQDLRDAVASLYAEQRNIRSTNADTLLTETDCTVLALTFFGDITVNLPEAADVPGKIYNIKKMDIENALTLSPSGSELIDGVADLIVVAQYASEIIQSSGNPGIGWLVLSSD
jgi:hypothetical protein